MAGFQWSQKVINYRLIEEISQTLNDGLFLLYCIQLEKSENVHFKFVLRGYETFTIDRSSTCCLPSLLMQLTEERFGTDQAYALSSIEVSLNDCVICSCHIILREENNTKETCLLQFLEDLLACVCQRIMYNRSRW